jgi:hypothetical protein
MRAEMSHLAEFGYVCYMVGKTGVIRVTNCWNDKFDTGHSNVLCVSSRDRRLLNNIDHMRIVGSIAVTCKNV